MSNIFLIMLANKMLAKWHTVDTPAGVKKVQGLGEKFVAEELVKHQIYWERPKSIKTPFGNYTPDFWLKEDDVFIEVKGMRTALKMVGILSLLENGRTKWAGSIDENSLKKMNWVRENIAPIHIYINDNVNDATYMRYLPDFEAKVLDFEVIYGRQNFISRLKDVSDWNTKAKESQNANG